MGEDRTGRNTSEAQRYTVRDAADILGISPGAVRNRLSRGTLPRVKESGTVYVLLPADISRATTDIPGSVSPSDSDVLTSELRDRLHYVEGQLEAERQAHSEARRLLAAALERIPAIEASESPESPGPTDAPTEDPGESQEGVQRPWWRRVFGG